MNNNKIIEPKIIFLAPTPPPYAGPEIVSQMLLETKAFKKAPLVIIKSNIRNNNSKKGRLDLPGFLAFAQVYFKVLNQLLFSNIFSFYFQLSSNKTAFIRDAIYILTAWILQKHIIGHYRGGYFNNFYHEQNNYFKKIIKYILYKIDILIIQGEIIKPSFKHIYPLNRLKVLYNGIDLKKCNQIVKIRKTHVFTILFIGHLWYPKGFYDLIVVYKKLYQKYGSKIRLLFAGERMRRQSGALYFLDGKWQDIFLKESKKICNEIENFIEHADRYNAKYLGSVFDEAKIKAFQESDIFVLPSYTEGFSMACLEAMSMGLPVIVTPVGAMPEIIKHGKNGLIIPIGDQSKLYDNIIELMTKPKLCNSIRKNNINYAKNFDIEIIAEKLIKILTN